MEKKKVLFSLLAIAFCGSVFIMAKPDREIKYTPKSEQIQKNITGINKVAVSLKTAGIDQLAADKDPLTGENQGTPVTPNNPATSKALDLTWSELGPDNFSGRTRAILIDRNNTSTIYAGSVGGGLWKSTTSGSSWTLINSISETIAISCIAQGIDGAIYVGTGEYFVKSDGTANGSTGFIGNGIYKSTDGNTFTSLVAPTEANNDTIEWAYINKLACDPMNANRVYAATNKGLRSSNNGGTDWINPVSSNTENAFDVDVASNGNVYASIGNKCFKSSDGSDNSFSCLSDGLVDHLPVNGILRLELAISPSNPSYVYACMAKDTTFTTDLGTLKNIYQSKNGGSTWTVVGPGGSSLFQPLGKEGRVSNTIVVHPTNPERVYVGGDDLWMWESGGSWTQKSMNEVYAGPEYSIFVHSGINTIVFNPSNPNFFFIGNNGGISECTDGGNTFQTMNINYSTVQCNAVSSSYDGKLMVGAQNNGTFYMTLSGPFPKHAENIMGGNGGWSTFSYINHEAYFATTKYGATRRSPDNGANFYPASFAQDASNHFYGPDMIPISNQESPGTDKYPAAYVTPIILWENFNDTTAYDSIEFTPALVQNEKIGKGLNGQVQFDTTLQRDGQPDAELVPGTLTIVCGSLLANDDGMGGLTGNINTSGVNTINYVTGKLTVTFSSAPPNGQNILCSYSTRFSSGSVISIESNNKPGVFSYTTPAAIETGDIVMVQDIIQAKFFVGLNNAIWMTKEPLDFAGRPEWFKLALVLPESGQTTQSMALSQDGNYLFAGTSNGKLFRLSNVREAQDSLTAICGDYVGTTYVPNPNSAIEFTEIDVDTNNRAITSIAINPDDPTKVIVTLGGYNNDNYVLYSDNALDSAAEFKPRQGDLKAMPVYTSLIPMFNSGTVMIGTEHGIYSTENISDSLPVWTAENTGLANVPVYMLWQQKQNFQDVTNYGTIYAATHGRGVFECTKYTQINDPEPESQNSTSTSFAVSVFPNPSYDNATLSYDLPQNGNTTVNVYDISGKLIKSIDLANQIKGMHLYKLDCNSLKAGTYFIQIDCGEKTSSTKFIKLQ
jgi:photosystem II stability/assembly factor-like uncharacterized protein